MSNKRKIKHPVEEIEELDGARRVIVTDPAQAEAYRALPGTTIQELAPDILKGTCVGCLMPTDTGLGLRGPAEWHLAFLVNLGMNEQEALGTFQAGMRDAGWPGPDEDGDIPDGIIDLAYRVCARCAGRAGHMRVALATAGAALPTYSPQS